ATFHGPLVARATLDAALSVDVRAVEVAALRRAVPLRGEHGDSRAVGHGTLQQEYVGFLAGLQDAELGVESCCRRDEPIGPRLGTAFGWGDAWPGRPALPCAGL